MHTIRVFPISIRHMVGQLPFVVWTIVEDPTALVHSSCVGTFSQVLCKIAAKTEMIEAAKNRLFPDELRILKLRQQGLTWIDIAAEGSNEPLAARKRLSLALKPISLEWELENGEP